MSPSVSPIVIGSPSGRVAGAVLGGARVAVRFAGILLPNDLMSKPRAAGGSTHWHEGSSWRSSDELEVAAAFPLGDDVGGEEPFPLPASCFCVVGGDIGAEGLTRPGALAERVDRLAEVNGQGGHMALPFLADQG